MWSNFRYVFWTTISFHPSNHYMLNFSETSNYFVSFIVAFTENELDSFTYLNTFEKNDFVQKLSVYFMGHWTNAVLLWEYFLSYFEKIEVNQPLTKAQRVQLSWDNQTTLCNRRLCLSSTGKPIFICFPVLPFFT